MAFVRWLSTRPEKEIAVVTHSSWLRHLFAEFGHQVVKVSVAKYVLAMWIRQVNELRLFQLLQLLQPNINIRASLLPRASARVVYAYSE
jgi:hypothetical protein